MTMNNQEIIDNEPDEATHFDRFGDYQKLNKDGESYQWTKMIGGNYNWWPEKPIVADIRSLADIRRIVELETQQARAEILIHELHEQVYDNKYLDNRVRLYEVLKERKQ
jgi:hypothetical protein